jgi:hypothetical protein
MIEHELKYFVKENYHGHGKMVNNTIDENHVFFHDIILVKGNPAYKHVFMSKLKNRDRRYKY